MATETRVSQLDAQVLNAGTEGVRVSQLAAEVANAGSEGVRVSQLVAELVQPNFNSGVRVSQLCVEVLAFSAPAIAPSNFPALLLFG